MSRSAIRTAIGNMAACCRISCTRPVRALSCAAGKSTSWKARSRSRIVVLEFPTYAAALACYRSPEYAKAIAVRQAAADADLLVIEGYDGVQPPLAASPPAAATAKGYWIGHIDVTERRRLQGLRDRRHGGVRKIRRSFSGARRHARIARRTHLRSRSVLLEFPSYRQRSLATARRIIKRQRSSATATPTPIF